MGFDYNKGGFWVAVIGLLVASFLTYLSIQNNWDVARASGALRKPQLTFGVGAGLPLEASAKTSLLIGARKISNGNAVVIAGIPFIVANAGDSTLENATLSFRFNKLFQRDALELLKFSTSGGFEASQVQRSFSTAGELQYSSYLIPALNPGQTMGGMEPIYLPKTSLTITEPVETADKKSMPVSVTIDLAFKFLVSVAAKDIQVRDYEMNFQATEATSLDDLTEQAKSKQIREKIREWRRNTTFGQYLKALVFGVPEEHLYLVYADLEERPTEDGVLYWAKPDPKVRLLSYKPVLWGLLFDNSAT